MFANVGMLILKVTRDCNLRCNYCFVKNKEKYTGELMDYDLFKRIVKKIVEDRIKNNSIGKRFDFVFHGGEPLLLGKSRLHKMLNYVSETFSRSNLNFRLLMQTNLTLLDDSTAKILRKYNVSLGISYDGFDRANSLRTKRFGDDFFKSKFRLMNKYKIRWSPLIVVSKMNLDDLVDSLEILKKFLHTTQMKINYVEDLYNLNIEVDSIQFFNKIQKPLIDNFIRTGKFLEANTGDKIISFIANSLSETEPMKNICRAKICGAGQTIVALNADGEYHLCGRFGEEHEIANLSGLNSADFLEAAKNRHLHRINRERHKHILELGCDLCPAKDICDFGCMAFSYEIIKTLGIRTNLVCPMHKALAKYLESHKMELIRSFYDNNKNSNGRAILHTIYHLKRIKDNALNSELFEAGVKISINPEDSRQLVLEKVQPESASI